jgi:hypothetical protein
VRYEDLTIEPEYWLRILCEFLGVTFDEKILVSSQPYLKNGPAEDDSNETTGRLRANSGNWKSYFDSSKKNRLERIGGKTLALFGYETNYPDSDFDPPAWKRRLWGSQDYVVQYAREIGLKLTGRIERPWRVILSRPFVAHKQQGENEY